MKRFGLYRSETTFVDTPEGIYTDAGIWFRTREQMLQGYAGAVFEREPLGRLLKQAEIWLRSSQTLTLWVLPLFLFWLPPPAAGAAALVFYVGWEGLAPSFVNRPLGRLLKVLDIVLLQAFYYVFMLSVFAAQQHFAALWVGLGGFILLRWGLVHRATQPVVRRIWATLYTLPVPDHVLRAFIVRAALAHRVSLPEFERIEQEIIKNLKRK